MALVLDDRVKETTTTTGTGTVTLAGAVSGFQSFAAIGNANTTYYTISGGTEWEVGIGTYTAAGTTLSRDTVLASSNAGSLVTFSAGSKEVICTYPAEKLVIQDGTSISAGTATLGVANGGTGTGTAFTTGSVVFAGASGVYSQDNATFFWDDTNNRLGIGTAAPGTNLHVFATNPVVQVQGQTTSAARLLAANGSGNFYIGVDNSTGSLFGSGAYARGIRAEGVYPLVFQTNSVERMRIHAAGGVSIGTTTDPGANNVTANSFQDGYTTTATAAGTTTLTVASTGMQYFTGSTTQTLVLPVTSTLQLGWSYHVANTSTGIVTVQSSGANVIVAIPPGLSVMFTCILTSGTTAASWDYGFTDFPAVTPVGSASLNDSLFRLDANGAAIGPAIADYFGTNSAVTLAAASVYELEFELFFTKTTAGTVTFTLTSDNAPVNLNAYWIGTAVGGVGTAAASPQAALVASTATAAALPATGSLTTAVNHHYNIKVVLNTHATLAETIRLRITSSAGTVTPLRNSRYTVKNLTTGNSGTFVA